MIRSLFKNMTTLVASALSAVSAAAHEGHGIPGADHWHTTDVWGFIAMAVIAAGAIAWWHGRD